MNNRVGSERIFFSSFVIKKIEYNKKEKKAARRKKRRLKSCLIQLQFHEKLFSAQVNKISLRLLLLLVRK